MILDCVQFRSSIAIFLCYNFIGDFMNKKLKKIFCLIISLIIFLFIIGLGIPLLHDFLFDRFSVSNYEVKEGIVNNVKLEEKKDVGTCENIVVDDYNIFVQCGKDYKQQFKIGDKTEYYIYKNKAYHTKDQMKSASLVGKILDYGMIGSYILIFFLIAYNRGKVYDYVDDISGKKK